MNGMNGDGSRRTDFARRSECTNIQIYAHFYEKLLLGTKAKSDGMQKAFPSSKSDFLPSPLMCGHLPRGVELLIDRSVLECWLGEGCAVLCLIKLKKSLTCVFGCCGLFNLSCETLFSGHMNLHPRHETSIAMAMANLTV
jgi:hypothetical protein